MRMNQDERRFDFHGLGMALKQAREEKGWTQAYVAELVGKTDRTIMNIENKGQHPSFNLFFKLVTLFDISVDQFFYTEGHRGEGSCRKHIDVLLSSMNEKELVVMEATAEGLKKARETEVQEYEPPFFHAILRAAAKGQAMPLWQQTTNAACWGSPQTRQLRANMARSDRVALLLIFHIFNAPFLSFSPAPSSRAGSRYWP